MLFASPWLAVVDGHGQSNITILLQPYENLGTTTAQETRRIRGVPFAGMKQGEMQLP
jgi:hypothetical protein